VKFGAPDSLRFSES